MNLMGVIDGDVKLSRTIVRRFQPTSASYATVSAVNSFVQWTYRRLPCHAGSGPCWVMPLEPAFRFRVSQTVEFISNF